MKNRAVSLFMNSPIGVSIAAAIGAAIVLWVSSVAIADINSGNFATASSSQVTTTNITINVPTAAANDVLLATIAVHGGNQASVTPPSGWTLIDNTDNDANLALLTYWKKDSSSEPGSYTWSVAKQTTAEGAIKAYSGVDSSNPIDAFQGNSGLSSSATTSAITTTTASDTIVALFAVDEGKTGNANNYFSTSSGMTDQNFDVSNTPFGPSISLQETKQSGSGLFGSVSAPMAGGNKPRNWTTEVIALRPPPPPTGPNPMTVDANTLALWSMNGSAGSAAKEADDSSAGLNLTEVGSPTSGTGYTTPTTDGAYVLDGSTQYLSSADTGFVTGNGARTIEAWIYRNNDSTEQDIFDYGTLNTGGTNSYGEWKLSLLPYASYQDVMHLDIAGAGCNGTVNVLPLGWHYVVSTYDGTTVRFYVDGNAAGTCTLSNTPNTVLSGTSYIGSKHGMSNEFFFGSIDQVKFSTGAKSATAIYDYYNGL